MGLIEVRNFSFFKDIVNRMKRQATNWENVFTSHILTKEKYLENMETHKSQR